MNLALFYSRLVFGRGKDKGDISPARQVAEFVAIIAVAIGAAFAFQYFFFKPYTIPSGSMIPTLSIGQRIFADRWAIRHGQPALGDVVVFNPPRGVASEVQCAQEPEIDSACAVSFPQLLPQTYIKRIVGLPGDRIAMRDGQIIRNGRPADEPFAELDSCLDNPEICSWSRPVVVPRGYYYMIGDNRGDSNDSRFWGPLPRKAITGKAVASYWPPSRFGWLNN